jgi:hypothetical protein
LGKVELRTFGVAIRGFFGGNLGGGVQRIGMATLFTFGLLLRCLEVLFCQKGEVPSDAFRILYVFGGLNLLLLCSCPCTIKFNYIST